MLEKVFTELYERGIMLFLDVDSYCINTVDINILKKRDEFLQHFDEPIEKGYVFTFNTSLEKLYKEIEENCCAVIKYGFESDTDDKAHDVGKNFVEILNNNGYLIKWTEYVKNKRIVTIVISQEDIPFNWKISDPYLLTLTADDNIQENSLVQFIPDQSPPNEHRIKCNEILSQIKSIQQDILECMCCEKRNDRDEMLTQSLLKLDGIPNINEEDIILARKNTLKYVQALSILFLRPELYRSL